MQGILQDANSLNVLMISTELAVDKINLLQYGRATRAIDDAPVLVWLMC